MSDPTQPDDLSGWGPPPVPGPLPDLGGAPPPSSFPPPSPPPGPAPGAAPPGYPPPGYPPSGYPPPGYGAPGAAYGYIGVREHPQGTTILVLGILGVVACQILGPVAWSMGQKALREIDAAPPNSYSNRGNVQAGRILGIVGTALLGLWALYLLFVLVVVLGAFGASAS